MKTFKLTNVSASLYAQISAMDCTLLQKAHLYAAVGAQTLFKVPTVILNRAGEFLCSVYDISADEFMKLGMEIKPTSESGNIGILEIAKAALYAPVVVIKHGATLIYRVVMSAANNFVGVFKDLLGIARDTKATMLCRFNPEAARLLLEQLKDVSDEEVVKFMTACGNDALDSLQDAALNAAIPTGTPNLVQSALAKLGELSGRIAAKHEELIKSTSQDAIDKKVELAVRKQLTAGMNMAGAQA